MKIGITGTACAGKTTLVHQLAKHFKFDVIEEISRNYNTKELHDKNNELIEYDLIFKQIRNEMFNNDNIITDRTVFDDYIYLENKGFKPRKYLLNLIRSWSQTYDIILLCEILPFVDDGFRQNINIEKDLIQFMDCNLIEYKILEGNESERFEIAKKIIERMLNK
jgi:nicotinamide riboside kinase